MGKPRIRSEREMMSRLIKQHGRDKAKVCRAFAKAERDGRVASNRRSAEMTPEEYAVALWNDGADKGWLWA